MSAQSDGAYPDLKDPDLYLRGVPYETFARLRREDPVHWNPEPDGPGFWCVTRQADIVEVSRNHALFSSAAARGGHRIFNENEVGLTGAGDSMLGTPFISRDPPSHTEYRKFVSPAVAPARLAGIEQRIEARCADLMAELPLGEEVDIVRALNAPLPLLTLAELIGVPGETWPDLLKWTNAFVAEDDPELRPEPEAMQALLGEFFAFAQALFERKRAEPSEDLGSLLANATVEGAPIRFNEFIGNLILVLVGGNETTRSSLTQTMMAFAEDQGAWDRVRENPALLRNAAPEMVRHASPVLHMRRTATADTVLGGKTIAAGSKVVLWYCSGNRDESVFPDPDRFDLDRRAAAHVGFGAGTHVCVGARLAELQLRVAFTQLAKRVRRFEVLAPPRRVRSNFINGLKDLKVRLEAA